MFDKINPVITVIKIGVTRCMIIPTKIVEQPEITKPEIPEFFSHKRVIGLGTIIQELADVFVNNNPVWKYYDRDQTLIYSNSREVRIQDMEDVRRWAMTLLNPELTPVTRAINKDFISSELLSMFCKIIGQKYPDHSCNRCGGENNVIPEVTIIEDMMKTGTSGRQEKEERIM
ncbi:uncharacterized protein LOC129903581 [Solanum dulcamara]|uniref:uncharacterized protein LOC129903581 n=1 Tax=Solanum dulcamara TaxID=45834 RepID=UPI002485F6E4|nr:uncharacterized protein LOC129903581 [Solanum dulcamara]